LAPEEHNGDWRIVTFSAPTTFASTSGAELALRHESARGDGKAVVQINHGLAEHAARYGQFAAELAEAGYHVYAHDHRGHGLTKADDAPHRGFHRTETGAEHVIDDVAAINAEIGRRHPGLPVVIFGHSMGGLIAMNYALRHPARLAGAAVWNANFSGGLLGRAAQVLLRWERFRLGADMPSRILPKLTFGAWAKTVKDRRTDYDWLSRDAAIVDAYTADIDCGWDASVGMWQAVFDLVFAGGDVAGAELEAKALPFHLVGGGEDPATDGGKAVEQQATRMKAAGFTDVSLSVYPDFRHETLNEVGREAAVRDFLTWLAKFT
jgi:alpha-beta hydrolase superfamily lysophospholipase